MEEDNIFEFDSPKESSSYIKVIGVGGGGSNAVNHMFYQGIKGVDFIVCNTDEKALNTSPVSNKIALDRLGAGNDPKVGREAAELHTDEIREALSHNTQMLFITAGMGGGTGTGAAPVIAQIAKSIDLDDDITGKILVVAIVTLPFSFEGRRRKEQAEAGIAELRKYVDSILVINNDKLRSFGDKGISGAFALANDVLLTAAKGIAEIITSNALINTDFRDVNTVMANSGTALMGTGEGRGENRALDAIQGATTSVLLNDNDICGAKDAILYINYGKDHEVTMDELAIITDYVTSQTQTPDCNIIWGYGEDDNLTDEIKVTLIATGFEKKATALPGSDTPAYKNPVDDKPHTYVLEDDKPIQTLDTTPAPAEDPNEMHIVKAVRTEEPVAAEPAAAPAQQPIAAAAAATATAVAAQIQTEAQAQPAAPAADVPTFHPEGRHHTEIVDGKTRNVFDLYETNEEVALAEEHAEEQPQNDDDSLLNIQMVSAPEPVAAAPDPTPAPAPQAIQQPVPAPAESPAPAEPQRVVVEQPAPMQHNRMSDNDTLSRADRIKKMHDLLTKSANGPQIVEDMAMDFTAFANTFTSNIREAQKTAINPDGSISDLNSYLYDNPD